MSRALQDDHALVKYRGTPLQTRLCLLLLQRREPSLYCRDGFTAGAFVTFMCSGQNQRSILHKRTKAVRGENERFICMFYLTATEGTSNNRCLCFAAKAHIKYSTSSFTGVIGALKHPLPVLSKLCIFVCVRSVHNTLS